MSVSLQIKKWFDGQCRLMHEDVYWEAESVRIHVHFTQSAGLEVRIGAYLYTQISLSYIDAFLLILACELIKKGQQQCG